MKTYLEVAYVAFYRYMYVYIWKLNKDLKIQMCKMQVHVNYATSWAISKPVFGFRNP